ncbi:hypothetical protein N9383_03345 [Granulosicoccus sp.]|nr:hypothetical protein [Granulosicoccus sp.]
MRWTVHVRFGEEAGRRLDRALSLTPPALLIKYVEIARLTMANTVPITCGWICGAPHIQP